MPLRTRPHPVTHFQVAPTYRWRPSQLSRWLVHAFVKVFDSRSLIHKRCRFICLFSSDWTNRNGHQMWALTETFTCTQRQGNSALGPTWSSFTWSCVNELKLFKFNSRFDELVLNFNFWIFVSGMLTLIKHSLFLADPERCDFIFKRTWVTFHRTIRVVL